MWAAGNARIDVRGRRRCAGVLGQARSVVRLVWQGYVDKAVAQALWARGKAEGARGGRCRAHDVCPYEVSAHLMALSVQWCLPLV